MKQVCRILIIGVVALIFTASVTAAAGLSTTGIGVKARGLGGAFRAIADDWSAAYWNPAGLANLESSELDFTLLLVNPQPTFTPATGDQLLGSGYRMKTGERYPDDHVLPFPSFSGFIKLPSTERITFGAAIYWTQDVNTSWDLIDIPAGYNNDVGPSKNDYRLDLDVWDFHPSLAVDVIKDKLQVGAGLSLQRGDLVFRRINLFANPWGPPYDGEPYHNFFGQMQYDANGLGVGANFGLLYALNDKLSIGLTGQTPVTVKLDGMTDLSVFFPRNDGLRDYDTTYSAYYQGGSAGDRSPFTMDLKLPGEIGLGFAYQANEQWTMSFDLGMTFWSQMREWEFVFDKPLDLGIKEINPLESFVLPLDYEDQLTLSFGAEYIVQDNVVVRGGYSYDATAAPDETFRPYFQDYGDRHTLSLGASVLWDKLEFAGQISGSFSGTRTIDKLYEVNNDGQFDSFPGEYKSNQVEFMMSTIYRF